MMQARRIDLARATFVFGFGENSEDEAQQVDIAQWISLGAEVERQREENARLRRINGWVLLFGLLMGAGFGISLLR